MKEMGKGQVLTKKIGELVPDGRNANKGTERGQQMIENSLRNFGAGRSILLDKNGKIIAGNKTVENAGAIGLEDILVVQTDGTKLVAVQRMDLDLDTASAQKAWEIADNRAGQVSLEWDGSVLAEMAGEIDMKQFFTEEEFAALVGAKVGSDLLTDEDDAPDVPAEATTKLGDLYVMGAHRLLCGDATAITDVDRLMDGEKADMVFTDPPYGVSFQSGMSKGGTATRFDKLQNDDVFLDVMPTIEVALRNDGAAFIWTSHQVYPRRREQFDSIYKSTIIWHKSGGGNRRRT